MQYDSQRMAAFFDEYGEREWLRFEDGRTSPISLAVHTHYLRRFVRAGDRVLDAGAGPAASRWSWHGWAPPSRWPTSHPGSWSFNRRTLIEAGLEDHIASRMQADILDLGAFDDEAFDATVCYGGPLSYILERADEALDELLRVTRPGGHMLLSVMSLVGATAGGLAGVMEIARTRGPEVVQGIIETGDLPAELSSHALMHMYRWSELRGLLEGHPCQIVAASASGLSYGRVHRDLHLSLSDEEREWLTRWEVDLAAEPSAVGIGEHIIAVVQKADQP